MKCYGEQYKPLFTCDNNSSIWGTQFCGLDVKSPEALKICQRIVVCIFVMYIIEKLNNN